MCDYLRSYGWEGRYTSVDISPDMIRIVKERLPKDEHLCIDILHNRLDRTFDYVFCGATLQHKPMHDSPKEYFSAMIYEMFRLAKRGVAFDCFSTRVDYMKDDNLYIDYGYLLELCYSITKRIVLKNDYRPYEIIMHLYKNESWDDSNIFNDWISPEPQIIA